MLYLYNDMGQQRTIYLVDDDDDDRFLIKDAVEGVIDDVKIIEFNNGIDFLAQIRQPGVTLESVLILLDINMPRMSGLEVISALKSELNVKKIPVLAISTASDPDLIKEIYAAGAAGYFTKPDSLKGIRQLAQDISNILLAAAPSR